MRTFLIALVTFGFGLAAGVLVDRTSPKGEVPAEEHLDTPAAGRTNAPNILDSGSIANPPTTNPGEAPPPSPLDVADIVARIDESRSIKEPTSRLEAMRDLYGTFAAVNPAAAFEDAIKRGAFIESPWTDAWLNTIASRWAANDLNGLLGYIEEFPTLGHRIAGAVLSNAPASRRKEVSKALGVSGWMERVVTADLIASADDDPEATLRTLPPDSPISFGVAAAWVTRDPEAALTKIVQSENNLHPFQVSRLVFAWARREPEAAMRWAELQPQGEKTARLLSSAIGGWAATDPNGAISAATNLADDDQRAIAVGSVLMQWIRADSQAALGWYSALAPDQRLRTIAPVAGTYANLDPEATVQWATSLTPEEQRIAIPFAISSISRDNPTRAIRLAESVQDRRARDASVSGAIGEWAQQAPLEALAYAREYENVELRQRLVGQALSHFRGHRELMTEALSSLEGESYFDDVASVSITFIAKLEEQIALLDKIKGSTQREAAAKRVYLRMKWSDPARAAQFRETYGIPDL
ncbi:MAG: hypothetical protein KDI19_07720 [Pseudomonadales bacterium]|nr:hypothetical protein [Pseudomonadales bacterium]